MTTGVRTILFAGGVILLGGGLYFYFTRQQRLLDDSDFRVVDIVVTNISGDNISLDVYVEYYNKSDIKATVNKIYLDIFVQGVRVCFISQNEPFVVDPVSSQPFVLNASFNPRALAQNLVDVLLTFTGQSSITTRVTGYASVTSGFVAVTVPIEGTKVLKF